MQTSTWNVHRFHSLDLHSHCQHCQLYKILQIMPKDSLQESFGIFPSLSLPNLKTPSSQTMRLKKWTNLKSVLVRECYSYNSTLNSIPWFLELIRNKVSVTLSQYERSTPRIVQTFRLKERQITCYCAYFWESHRIHSFLTKYIFALK